MYSNYGCGDDGSKSRTWLVYDMGKNVVKSKDWINIVIMIASFCVSYFLNVNIIFIILGVAAFGFVRTLLKEGKKR